jgi:hypothetical protein
MTQEVAKPQYDAVPLPARIAIHSILADNQGCGHYRVICPAVFLNTYALPQVSFMQSYGQVRPTDPLFYREYTFVQYQRATRDQDIGFMQYYLNNVQTLIGVPLVVEHDDLFLEIPDWNMAAPFYKAHREQVIKGLRLANGVTVATEYMAQKVREHNHQVAVTPNRLLRSLWGDPVPMIREQGKGRKLRLVYPGSANHFAQPGAKAKGGDIGPTLMDYIKKTAKRFEWVFVGGFPQELTEEINTGLIKLMPWKPFFNYPAYLRNMQADIGIAPLADCPFNRAKSNLKLLEFTAIGIPGVFAELEPYSQASVQAGDDGQFIKGIEYLAEDPQHRLDAWTENYKVLAQEMYWEDNDNGLKHVNAMMRLFGREIRLPPEG